MGNTDVQENNIRIARSVFGTVFRDGAERLFSRDFICHVAEGLPYGREYRGPEGYLELMGHIKNFWSDVRQESQQFIPYGNDKVVIHFTLDGHMAKNGQHLRMPVIAIWEIKDGKVIDIRIFYFDTKRVADLAAM